MPSTSNSSLAPTSVRNIKIKKLLKILSDGNSHSGSRLGERLGITRSAVWKLINQLKQEMGLNIAAKTNQGYQVQESFELLDLRKIKTHLAQHHHIWLKKGVIFDEIPSTSNYLLEQLRQNNNTSTRVCLAEMQTAGRGKFNRRWLSPYGNNIYLSVLWHFLKDLPQLSGLSLAVAVAITRALKKYGVCHDITVKWPNDFMWRGRKLGGVLIDLRGEFNFNCDAVIGIGLNLFMPETLKNSLDFPVADLSEIIQQIPERNKLIALLLEELFDTLTVFQKHGLQPFIQDFVAVNGTLNKAVQITLGTEIYYGIGRGIDDQGCFLLENEVGVIQRFSCGEASLRIPE